MEAQFKHENKETNLICGEQIVKLVQLDIPQDVDRPVQLSVPYQTVDERIHFGEESTFGVFFRDFPSLGDELYCTRDEFALHHNIPDELLVIQLRPKPLDHSKLGTTRANTHDS